MGGIPPYQIGGQTSESGEFLVQDLAAGDYNLLVTDARDSTLSVSATVLEPRRLFLDPFVTGQNSLEGGSISLTPFGGIPPYSFAWADTSLTINIREDLDFGDYTVTLTDANGCELMETYTVDDLTSVPLLSAQAFRLYPTLATDQLTVEMANGLTMKSISCLDLNGRVLATTLGDSQSKLVLGAEFLPQTNGSYLISIVTTNGERGVGRIVVAH